MALFLPFSGHALTSQTTANQIQGTPPYLTFDGGRTRAVDANGLLGITLSDGAHYTPSTNSSSATPIVLPVEGQSFADIRMFVPTDTNSVALSSLIGPPNNYWGDDDGDSDVTATGSLRLFIVDKRGIIASRTKEPEICNSPYKVELSSTDGTLSTRYGVPNRSDFRASNVTYYVNPKAAPVVCFARPNLKYGGDVYDNGDITYDFRGPASMWDPFRGFITQSTDPSSYGLNFPITGANGLYFDLDIGGGGSLSWSPVSHGGITATMTNSPVITTGGVRVTLTGPYATISQQISDNPSRISTPSLPQTFELVGRDINGTPVVKYGFTLKQWFVNRGGVERTHYNTLSWCNSIGYRLVKVKDLTNANYNNLGATPSASGGRYMRHIGSGFVTEWGRMFDYSGVGFFYEKPWYWTSDSIRGNWLLVNTRDGSLKTMFSAAYSGLCAYP